MKKIIKERGNNGTGCIVLTKEELEIGMNAEIGDTIDIQRYKIIKKEKKEDDPTKR